MKDFASFRMKSNHPFDVSYRNRSVFIQIRNLRIFASKVFKELNEIAPNIFPNILISMTSENFGPHYQSDFQLNVGKISI